VRIVGGTLRGRKVHYSGDLRTRPMKDRLREAVFNLLGEEVSGRLAIDLFAGTGVLGLEAVSRGATRAVLIERHLPTAQLIQRSARDLGIADRVEVVFGDAFQWSRQFQPPPEARLLVFCCPPYEFYTTQSQAMQELIRRWIELPAASTVLVVEATEDFDWSTLPHPSAWRVRLYPPASIGIWESPPRT
jgi:16S rRNA (guanine(966)-N(2))-methyltransferase RsmD